MYQVKNTTYSLRFHILTFKTTGSNNQFMSELCNSISIGYINGQIKIYHLVGQ